MIEIILGCMIEFSTILGIFIINYHHFQLNGKFKILMFSSEKSHLDLSELTLFQFKNIFFTYKNPYLGEFFF